MKWAAFYSQTGSEICDISDKLGRYPDLVITDNVTGEPKTDSRIVNSKAINTRQYRSLSKQEKIDYYNILDGYDIITLHGWLNIVPASVCNKYRMYNGHPGLITYYPELKGKDPQKRAWENIASYMYIGSVIHNVTAEVDGGNVAVQKKRLSVNCTSLDETYKELKETSLETWVEFLGDIL